MGLVVFIRTGVCVNACVRERDSVNCIDVYRYLNHLVLLSAGLTGSKVKNMWHTDVAVLVVFQQQNSSDAEVEDAEGGLE